MSSENCIVSIGLIEMITRDAKLVVREMRSTSTILFRHARCAALVVKSQIIKVRLVKANAKKTEMK